MTDGDAAASLSFWTSRRMHIAVLVLYMVFAQTMMRAHMGFAMVCMVRDTSVENDTTAPTFNEQGCQKPLHNGSSIGELLWDDSDQALQYSAVYWGSIVSTIPSGSLADRFGARRLVLLSSALLAIGTLTTPIAARASPAFTFVARFFVGLGVGFQIPVAASWVTKWFPPEERSTVMGIQGMGSQLSSVVANPLSSWLCQSSLGWPSIFYLQSLFLVPLVLTWIFLITDAPKDCRYLSQTEKDYLTKKQTALASKRTPKSAPWLKIATSTAVIAAVASQFGANFILTTMESYLPTYFQDALYMNLKNNGVASAIPYLAQVVAKLVLSALADVLKRRFPSRTTLITKLFNSFGTFVAAACVAGLLLVDCHNAALGVVFFSLATFCFGAWVPGYISSLVLMAPAYSGLLMSIALTAGQLSGLLAPNVIALLTPTGSLSEWQHVIWLLLGLLLLSGTIFNIWGSVALQSWNDSGEEEDSADRIKGIKVVPLRMQYKCFDSDHLTHESSKR